MKHFLILLSNDSVVWSKIVFGVTRGLINRAPEIVRPSGEPLTRRPGRPLREG